MVDKNRISSKTLVSMMDQKKYPDIRALFRSVEAADISESLESLDLARCIAFFRMIPKDRRSEAFSHLSFDKQQGMLERLPDIVAINILNEMEPVDRTQLLEELPEDVRVKKIAMLNPEERNMAWQLLSYPEDSVGRLMSPEFVAISSDMTVKEALADIRWNAEKTSNTAHHTS